MLQRKILVTETAQSVATYRTSNPKATSRMGTFAEELYSETLKLADVKLDSSSFYGVHTDETTGNGSAHEHDDVFLDVSNEVDETSHLDREWEKRREGFHTIGYRDGIIAGKEASAQEGFNLGFKESVNAGYRLGLVRGVTSALALLPDGMKEKLIGTDPKRIQQIQSLFESTSSLSSTQAMKLFHDDVVLNKREDGKMTTSGSTSECLIDKYYKEMTLFVKEFPALNIQPMIEP